MTIETIVTRIIVPVHPTLIVYVRAVEERIVCLSLLCVSQSFGWVHRVLHHANEGRRGEEGQEGGSPGAADEVHEGHEGRQEGPERGNVTIINLFQKFKFRKSNL